MLPRLRMVDCKANNYWAATRDFQQCCVCDQQRLRQACAYAQSDQSHCLSFECSMSVKLLTEHHLEFLSLKWGSSESTHVKMSHCWKTHVAAQLFLFAAKSSQLKNIFSHLPIQTYVVGTPKEYGIPKHTKHRIKLMIGNWSHFRWFSHFSIKTHVVGSQKNRLNETGSLSTQNTNCLRLRRHYFMINHSQKYRNRPGSNSQPL